MKKTLLALALASALLLSGCGTSSGTQSGTWKLYFASNADSGAAVVPENYIPAQSVPGVDELLAALMAGPGSENMTSPFPSGTYVRSWTLQDGVLTVDVSENYGDLSGIDLTIADYCITLTMCQLEDVDSVTVTVDGEELRSRSHQDLHVDEVLTSGVPAGGDAQTD